MINTKHTPGPWEVEKIARGTERIQAGTKIIAWVDQVNHNARLIAAAPEMLEALDWAESEMENAQIGLRADPLAYVTAIINGLENARKKARAAITKATLNPESEA